MGFIFGFFLSGRLAKTRMDKVRGRMEKPKAEQQFLSRQLNLTAEQQEQFLSVHNRILEENQKLEQEHLEYTSTIHEKTKRLDIARNNSNVQINILKKRM